MDIFQAIEQRHSVRDYLEKEIEDFLTQFKKDYVH